MVKLIGFVFCYISAWVALAMMSLCFDDSGLRPLLFTDGSMALRWFCLYPTLPRFTSGDIFYVCDIASLTDRSITSIGQFLRLPLVQVFEQ